MYKTLIIVILISTFNKTLACLNGGSMILKDRTFVFADRAGNVPYGHEFNGNIAFIRGIKNLDSLYSTTKDIDFLSDKGLLLILLKDYDQAIKLYLEIEEMHPNRYSTASNLGTAYELVGQNEKALKWIKKSIEIDPKSHKNSEWIHVKILEAKIKGEQLYTTEFLLNTDFGSENSPKTSLTKDELRKLSDALYYQLNERISFVKPKEKIVAQLLFDLGNIAFLLGNHHDAKADYEQARKYGFTGYLLETRINESKRLTKKVTPSQTIHKEEDKYNYFIYGIIALTILTLISIYIFRRIKKTTANTRL